jgi:hypothetical protein
MSSSKSSTARAIGKELERLHILSAKATNSGDWELTTAQEFLDHLDPAFQFWPEDSGTPQSWEGAIKGWQNILKDFPGYRYNVENISSDVDEHKGIAWVHIDASVDGTGGVKHSWRTEARWRRDLNGKWVLRELMGLRGAGDIHRGFM